MNINQVIPAFYIKGLTIAEFEMIFNGLSNIDLKDWEFNTIYQGKYYKDHKVIKWFWEILKTYSQDQLQKLLRFCTGSSRTPIEGFRVLESNRG